MSATITLPFDNRTQNYDRDRLATAVLVYLDVLGGGTPCLDDTVTTSHILRADHGFGSESITYAVGARIAIENNIEP